ncbi:hypothetical protein IJU97_06675 [bacterium]|nr:hypothetical protein [bacterium]
MRFETEKDLENCAKKWAFELNVLIFFLAIGFIALLVLLFVSFFKGAIPYLEILLILIIVAMAFCGLRLRYVDKIISKEPIYAWLRRALLLEKQKKGASVDNAEITRLTKRIKSRIKGCSDGESS